MIHHNCYFCGKVCRPEKPDPRGMPTGRYVCIDHPSYVWHNYSRIPAEEKDGWSYIYFSVDLGPCIYGFGFYPQANALQIVRYDRIEETEPKINGYQRFKGAEINIRHIPKNLTPENAKEKLPFYLTFW